MKQIKELIDLTRSTMRLDSCKCRKLMSFARLGHMGIELFGMCTDDSRSSHEECALLCRTRFSRRLIDRCKDTINIDTWCANKTYKLERGIASFIDSTPNESFFSK